MIMPNLLIKRFGIIPFVVRIYRKEKLRFFCFSFSRNIKHSRSYGLFYSEVEAKKENFIPENSKDKWYNQGRSLFFIQNSNKKRRMFYDKFQEMLCQ